MFEKYESSEKVQNGKEPPTNFNQYGTTNGRQQFTNNICFIKTNEPIEQVSNYLKPNGERKRIKQVHQKLKRQYDQPLPKVNHLHNLQPNRRQHKQTRIRKPIKPKRGKVVLKLKKQQFRFGKVTQLCPRRPNRTHEILHKIQLVKPKKLREPKKLNKRFG